VKKGTDDNLISCTMLLLLGVHRRVLLLWWVRWRSVLCWYLVLLLRRSCRPRNTPHGWHPIVAGSI
jgi:hypothetical protein